MLRQTDPFLHTLLYNSFDRPSIRFWKEQKGDAMHRPVVDIKRGSTHK